MACRLFRDELCSKKTGRQEVEEQFGERLQRVKEEPKQRSQGAVRVRRLGLAKVEMREWQLDRELQSAKVGAQ
jgi:hypothetical protein